MSVYKWRRRPTKHFGEVSVPFAHIEIQGPDKRFQAFALQIDSGAVVSLLRRSVADLLNLDLEAGRRIEVSSVGGAPTVAYVHELHTRLADTIASTVPFAIAESETVPNLLGRLGVFDVLQVDFDATLEETRITAPWLDPAGRRIWEFLLSVERHVLERSTGIELPSPAKEVAKRFVERAGQLLADTAGLMKLHRGYAGPLFIRALFELALQFEYLMQDPGPRAQQYLDFTPVTRYRESRAITEHPHGPISTWVASSPQRREGEKRNEAEYKRVREQFTRRTRKGGARVAGAWYSKSVRELAEELGWAGEYKVLYAGCSAWAHGDPFSTQPIASQWGSNPRILFMVCAKYYAHILSRVADVGRVVLTSEQYEFLKGLTVGLG